MRQSCAAAQRARLADPPQLSVVSHHAATCAACRSWGEELEALGTIIQRAAARGPDDILRSRIQARLDAAIGSLAKPGGQDHTGRGRPAVRLLAAAIGVAAVALIALVLVPRQPATRSPRPALTAARWSTALIPHVAAGPVAKDPAVRASLGIATRVLDVDHAGGLLRAEVAPVGRLTLVGPGRVAIEHDAVDEIGLRLDRGLLLLSVDPRRQARVWVRVGELVVTVKGTVFAVDARRSQTRVSVGRGIVSVREADGPSRLLRRRQSWRVGEQDVAPIDDDTDRLLDEHDQVPAYTDRKQTGLLFLEGSPSNGTARLGEVLLGPTPIAARLPREPTSLTLEAAGYATSSVTVEIRGDKPTRVGYGLSPTVAPEAREPGVRSGDAPRVISATDRYARAEAAMATRDRWRARWHLAALLEQHPRSTLASTALLDLARLSGELGETAAQRRYLRRLLRRHGVGRALRDSAHLQLCRCELSLRRRAVARQCLREHRAAFPSSPGASEALSLLAVLELADGCQGVLPLLSAHDRRFPETPLIKKLRRRCPGK